MEREERGMEMGEGGREKKKEEEEEREKEEETGKSPQEEGTERRRGMEGRAKETEAVGGKSSGN